MAGNLNDQLVQDLTAYLLAHVPAGLPEDFAIPGEGGYRIYDFTRQDERVLPCVVIGHELGEMDPDMDGTGYPKLRILVMTDKDETPDAVHRDAVGAISAAIRDLQRALPGTQVLELVYLHDLIPEAPAESTPDHRRITVLSWKAVATLCEAA